MSAFDRIVELVRYKHNDTCWNPECLCPDEMFEAEAADILREHDMENR